MSGKKKLLTRRNFLRSSLAAPAILTFPRGLISPAGAPCTATGFGYPGGMPAIARANGLNTVSFFDDFNFTYPGSGIVPADATIDYNNTGAAGYKWYVNPNTPQAKIPTSNCGGWLLNGYPTSPANELVVANSVLTLGYASNAWNVIQTIDAGAGIYGKYVGTAFSGAQSFLIEARFQYSGPGSGAVFCMYSLELYTGEATTWLEIDGYEAVYDLYDGFHYHNFGVSPCIDDAISQPAPTQDSNWHTYDILYTYNSPSSGTITRYYDGSIWNTSLGH
jgi:hypothetical protein